MKYALWLANIPGIGNQKIRYLLQECQNAREIYNLEERYFEKIYGIDDADIKRIVTSRRIWNLDAELWKLGEHGIHFASWEQKEFPDKLRKIPSAPYALYYKGKLPDPKRKAVAIVGARGRSEYGCSVARELAQKLVNSGIDVISGMARGIDADGHVGALDAGGETYAVLGCGVDICYPAQNRFLYEMIPQKGGLISEYPPHTAAKASLFPARNRIISGLSDCVVVVEAREKSGSLITADYAIEQGKEVFAVPGRVKDSLSRGCNRLIHEGAGIFQDTETFLADWLLLQNLETGQMDFKDFLLEQDEKQIYGYLDFTPVGIGTLVEKTSLRLDEILDILDKLTQKGMAKEIIPNYYVRVN